MGDRHTDTQNLWNLEMLTHLIKNPEFPDEQSKISNLDFFEFVAVALSLRDILHIFSRINTF